jgi:cyanate lyase
MNTTKSAPRVKVSFCRCGTQFQVETRGQKSCPACIEARAIAEANKPPIICRHCGEAKKDCKRRICPDCKAAKEQAEAAKRPLQCKTCGELSLDTYRGKCSACHSAAWELRQAEMKEERKRERQERYEAERAARRAQEPEPVPETDPLILQAYEAISMLGNVIKERLKELRDEAAAVAQELPLEQRPHADQDAIDATAASILAGLDI